MAAVYEHLVFEGHEHLSIRSLPGMAKRTLRIGSAGKTFSLTAWKVCSERTPVWEAQLAALRVQATVAPSELRRLSPHTTGSCFARHRHTPLYVASASSCLHGCQLVAASAMTLRRLCLRIRLGT